MNIDNYSVEILNVEDSINVTGGGECPCEAWYDSIWTIATGVKAWCKMAIEAGRYQSSLPSHLKK
ncbi:hypothetical protein [Siphonobacter sp. BAB-5405]|uniref:hypothetical protein n=1 Tax=Siphonobacter sp. BAB-5405 TaxID=1864825 RepID=UPI0011404D5C|nr:hypothetical protein [Siphonobacter sp. BAB-5405]